MNCFFYINSTRPYTVYRWKYNPGTRVRLDWEDRTVIVQGMPGEGPDYVAHITRTLVFDQEGRLYVSVGSIADVDSDFVKDRAVIVRFANVENAQLPIDYKNGEVRCYIEETLLAVLSDFKLCLDNCNWSPQ